MLKLAEQRAGGDVPKANEVVRPPPRDRPAVRRERDAVDATGVAFEGRPRSRGADVPDHHLRIVIAGDQGAAVRAECGALNGRVPGSQERLES